MKEISTKRSRRKPLIVNYGRMDIATPMSGLFTVPPKGHDSHMRTVRLTRTHGDFKFEFISPFQMDHVAWRLLVAICGLCGIEREVFKEDSDDAVLSHLWSKLQTEGAATASPSLRWKGSLNHLMREAGITPSGSAATRAYERLKQLSSVRHFMEKGSRLASGTNLISFAVDRETGELSIALSPIVVIAIIGGKKIQYSRISLAEIRQLTKPAAVILHGQLSARVRRNAQTPRRYTIDQLVDLVYTNEQIADATQRTRRKVIRDALVEIDALDHWQIIEDAKTGEYMVYRSPEPKVLVDAAEAA